MSRGSPVVTDITYGKIRVAVSVITSVLNHEAWGSMGADDDLNHGKLAIRGGPGLPSP